MSVGHALSDDKRLLVERIRSHADAPDQRTAVEQGSRRLTYADLRTALVERVAALASSVAPGDLVPVHGPRSVEFVVEFLALLARGAVPVPLEQDLPDIRRREMRDNLPARVGNGDAAYVFFTSGSTGLPKPILGSARGLKAFIAWQSDQFGVGAGDRVGFLTAVGFDVCLRDMLLPLYSGATLVIPDRDETDSTVDWLSRHGITTVHAVPSVARAWLNHGRTVCDTLRTVFFAGEPLTSGLLRDWSTRFPATGTQVNLYGPTETTLAKFWHRVGPADLAADPVPVGTALPGTSWCLLGHGEQFDATAVRRCQREPSDDGEIVIVTPHASHGYLGPRSAEHERFLDLGAGLTAYRTGDLGRRRADGLLVVSGRVDDEIKINGIRIHPAEVTAALRTHAGVRDAFVLPTPEHRLVAYVVAAGSAGAPAPSDEDMRAHLAERLPRAMAPARFVGLAELPLTANGKVDRVALAALTPGTAPQRGEAPVGEVERWLAVQWAELLGTPEVSATEDFFSLGGTSLFATQLAARIRQEFTVDVPVGAIFARPTVRALATELLATGRTEPGPGSEAPAMRRVDRSGDRLPMSFAQHRLYFLQAIDPAGAAYHICEALRLRGPLDVPRLRRALRSTVARHEVLRTVCVHDGDEPVLSVVDNPVDIEIVEGSRADLPGILAERSRRPFRLDAEPPLRATLLRLAGDEHVLLLVVHHIASDERSTHLFLAELFVTYAGQGTPAPPADIQYADYAAWQREALTTDVLRRHAAYWRERLAGTAPVLELPAERPRPDLRSDRAAELRLILDARVCARLREAARRMSVTPFAILLTAFGYVLHRHCATDDVVVGTPADERTRPEVSDVLGCFINTLVLRLDFTGAPSRRELVRRTSDCVLGAIEHRDLPFERLVAELKPERVPGVGQLVQAMFNYHDAVTVDASGTGLAIARLPLDKPGAQFDLACTVEDHGDTMLARLVYAVDFLSHDLVRRLGEHLAEVVEALPADLDAPAGTLPAVPYSDAILTRQCDAEPCTSPPAIRRFEAHASAHPDRTAVRCLEDVASYGELDRRANRLAHYLGRRGIGRGDVVALLYQRSVDIVVAMLAVQKAGATYVPLDPVFPASHVATILAEANAALVLTHEAVDSAAVAASAPAGVVVVERIEAELSGCPESTVDTSVEPDDAMYILFTSGSTGRPKGVVVEHRNLANFLDGLVSTMDLSPHLHFANVTTFAADLGMTNVYGALTTGGTLHVIPYAMATDPELLAGYFRRHRIDFMKSVPSHLAALADAGVLDAVVPARYLVLAGEAFDWDLADRIRQANPRCEIWNHYGPTETTVDVLTYRVPDGTDTQRRGATVPIGYPIDRVHVHVVDRHLRPSPVGTPGELLIGGASVARGYLSTTDSSFIPDPFSVNPHARAYRTGDRVRLLSDGAIEFLGRTDRQVKIRGYRVEPSHVEAVLRGHPSVADAAVAVRQDAHGRGTLVAYYVCADGGPIAPRELHEHARAQLPSYLVPSALVPIPRLPVTPNGKLDWRALPEPDLAAGREGTRTPPRDARDARIAGIWRTALGLAEVGIDDDFFALGGDSLTAMRVVRQIGGGLRVMALFQHPTVRRLADHIEAAAPPDRLLYRMSGSAAAPPVATIVAVPFGGGSATAYRDLALALPPQFPLYAVELPGHDYANPAQRPEPFDRIVDRVVTEVRETIAGPVVVYGHCVGAAMAHAIAQRLDAEGSDVVGAVFGAAYPSPHLPGHLVGLWTRFFPSDRWKGDRLYQEMLRAIGGFSDAVDPAEQAFVVRALRHDSRGADTYFSRTCHDPCYDRRLAALCVVGERDRLTEFHEERYREWDLLCAGTDLAVVPDAGHYFVQHQTGALADHIVAWTRRRLEPTTPDPVPAPAPARAPRGRASMARFAAVSLGQLLSMTGTRISAFGLGVWVYLETGSATRFSFILACALLPGLLALPFAGALVDRWDRRKVMIIGDLVGVSGTGLCLVMHAAGALELWHVYVAAGLGSVANAFQQPAYIAATAQLVPKQYLPRVNGAVQALVAASLTAGPLLGAALIVGVGVGGVLAIDVATLALSVAILLVVRFPDTLFRRREESVWREVAGGFRYIARRRGFVAMNSYFLAYNLLLGFAVALTPPIVLSFASAGMLSLATAMGGIGGVVGGLVMALWGGFERRATGMIGFCALTGVGMILVGLHPSPLYPILGLAAIGASIALLNGHWQTLIQNKVGLELQGRMITTNRMIANLTEPLGYFFAGRLADALFEPAMRPGGWLYGSAGPVFGAGPGRGMALMIVVLGAVQILVAIAGLRWSTLHHMEDALPDATPGAIVTWDRDRLQEEADRLLRHTPSPTRDIMTMPRDTVSRPRRPAQDPASQPKGAVPRRSAARATGPAGRR